MTKVIWYSIILLIKLVGKRGILTETQEEQEMRKKVLAALLAAAVAGTTVMSGMTAFAAETEGTKAEGGNITIAETADPQNINPLYVVDQTSFDDAGTVQPVF